MHSVHKTGAPVERNIRMHAAPVSQTQWLGIDFIRISAPVGSERACCAHRTQTHNQQRQSNRAKLKAKYFVTVRTGAISHATCERSSAHKRGAICLRRLRRANVENCARALEITGFLNICLRSFRFVRVVNVVTSTSARINRGVNGGGPDNSE